MPTVILSPIHKVSRQIGIHLEGSMVDMGISTLEGHLLSFVKHYPSPISQLQRVFGIKQTTLTSLLDRLENRKLIIRKPNPDDRRSYVIEVTKKGMKITNVVERAVEELERDIRSRLRKNDLAGFQAVLQAIGDVTGVVVRE